MSFRFMCLAGVFAFLAAPVLAATEEEKALAAGLQLELNRLGCEAGTADGLWGAGSKAALARYAEKIGAAGLDDSPSQALLSQLRAETGRLCTLPPGVIAGADRATTADLEAVKYSYKLWSTLPARVVSEETEYGLLRCEAGKNGGPRDCAWQ